MSTNTSTARTDPIPELLAPAGDPDSLRLAVAFGADAVYLSLRNQGLRAGSRNFTPDELREGMALAHARGVRVYAALNRILRPGDVPALREAARFLQEAGADAAIVADPGVLDLVREEAPGLALHISTQASVASAEACRFWHRAGASRVVLARELGLSEIRAIRRDLPPDLELEAFVHGAMCVAWSGRCLLSLALTGRDANQGRCAQPCRWPYEVGVRELSRSEWMPVEQDGTGTYVFNSRDLCLLPRLADLADAGLSSLKIEGRAKSGFYAAVVTRAYRAALDALRDEGGVSPGLEQVLLRELAGTSHRPFDTGFYFHDVADPGRPATAPDQPGYLRSDTWVGRVAGAWAGASGDDRRLAVEMRNRFGEGECLDLLVPGEPVRPDRPFRRIPVRDLRDVSGAPVAEALHPMAIVTLALDPGEPPIPADSLLRRSGGTESGPASRPDQGSGTT